MKQTTVLFSLLLFFLAARGQSITDGPFVLYRNTDFLVLSLHNGQLTKDSASYDKRPGYALQVRLSDSVQRQFALRLKPELKDEPSEYKKVEKIFALSDIEGTFEGFVQLLVAGGVVNKALHWSFGKGHLVVCGDVFDRGADVTACLWLLYGLEEEAKKAGGYVHYLLGNHEVMNLSDDTRYVHPKHSEAARLLGVPYEALYNINTELGRWLRTKNVMERIGPHLFLHGGVSPALNAAGLSLKKINGKVKPLYDKDGYDSLLQKENAALLFNSLTSPFWYRGYFVAPLASEATVDSSLRLFDVQKIVVGHTLVDSVHARYGGKVIALDVNHHKGNHQALLVEGDKYYRVDGNGRKTALY